MLSLLRVLMSVLRITEHIALSYLDLWPMCPMCTASFGVGRHSLPLTRNRQVLMIELMTGDIDPSSTFRKNSGASKV